MLLLIQWTRADPLGWEAVEVSNSNHWRNLPSREDPTLLSPQPSPDDEPGWVFALGCQGFTFSGDHYAVEAAGSGGLHIHIINDDPDDFPPGHRHAYVWTLNPLRPDPRFGGRLNTDQALTIFTEPDVAPRLPVGINGEPVVFHPFGDYKQLPSNMYRHGLQVEDGLAETHLGRRAPSRWEDWIP